MSSSRYIGCRLVLEANRLLDVDPSKALLVAIEAAKRDPGLPASNALYAALARERESACLNHGSEIFDVAFRANGAELATCARDGYVRVWQPDSGELLSQWSLDDCAPFCAAFVGASDRLIVGWSDGGLKLHRASDGQLLETLFVGETTVQTVCCDAVGHVACAVWTDANLHVYDFSQGYQPRIVGADRADDDPHAQLAALGQDGQHVVSAWSDGSLRLLGSDGIERSRIEVGSIEHATIAGSDSTNVLALDHQGGIRRWRTTHDADYAEVLLATDQLVGRGAIDASGRFACIAPFVNTFYERERNALEIWNIEHGQRIAELRSTAGAIESVTWSNDQRRVATSSTDHSVRIWPVGSAGTASTGRLDLPGTSAFAFAPHGREVIAVQSRESEFAGVARIWDFDAKSAIRELATSGDTDVVSAAFSRDATRVVAACADATARVFDATSGEELLVLGGDSDPIDEKTRAALRQLDLCQGLIHAEFDPEGRRIVTADSFRGTARVWDAANGSMLQRISAHRGQVSMATFSPDGRHVLTVSGTERCARLFDATTGEAFRTLPWEDSNSMFTWPIPIRAAAFSPDGTHVAVAEIAGKVRVWNLAEERVTLELAGHRPHPLAVSYSPDGERIVTAGADAIARVWDARSGACTAELDAHHGAISDATFSPDGATIVTVAAWTDELRVWPVDVLAAAEAQRTRSLTDAERTALGIASDS